MTDDELKRLLEANAAETRRHFDVATERIEHRFEALAETVLHVDQKIDRTAEDIRDEMRRGFAETQAMIRFSHVELDQRVRSLETSHRAIETTQRSLEETVADLQVRLERLESTTH
ncbi:MAG: hypothetical protein QOJ98_3582 [Acidobacteriota bacterium]|jgi:predicted  nucleic acid-binding Zn-ribbon protein|nr:hypothetical protein [Acidobacteriota bacterium]